MIRSIRKHTDWITALDLSPDGVLLASGDAIGTVRVYQTSDGKPLGEISSNPPAIEARLAEIGERLAKQPDDRGLLAARRHWTAAAINTRAFAARRESGESAHQAEARLDEFIAAAAGVTTAAGIPNAKRAERQSLASRFATSPMAAEVARELDATLAAIDCEIARQHEALRLTESAARSIREAAEKEVPRLHASLRNAEDLKKAYQAAR